MKILYYNYELAGADGSNSHAIGLYKALCKKLGNENVYAYPEPEDGSIKTYNFRAEKIKDLLRGPLQVLRYIRKTILSYQTANKLVDLIREKKITPEIILARTTVFDIAPLLIARRSGLKLVYEVNAPIFYEVCVVVKMPLRWLVERWERKILNRADKIYAVSNVVKEMMIKNYKISSEKFIVIPNGYREDLFNVNESTYNAIRTQVREENNVQEKFVVTFLGSLKRWHGIDSFIQLSNLTKLNNKIEFWILGDGEMREEVLKAVNSLDANIKYFGKLCLEDMRNHLYASDLGIMPYPKGENFFYSPLKMFDMIGANLPFIGTRIAQIEEICSRFFSQDFLMSDNSPNCMAENIDHILNSTVQLQQMKNAILNNKHMFSWQKRAEELLYEFERWS